ncbi:TNF receptor-associated factor 2-like isoform X1 [Littorina saxatilis]
MSAAKLDIPSPQRQLQNQLRNQSPNMASGGASAPQSLATDSVPVGPQRFLAGYQPEVFEKKEDRDRFSCGYCGKILREPLQAECGHRFCECCKEPIEESVKAGKSVCCKICKDEGCSDEESRLDPKQMLPDRGIRREMLKLKAKCPNEMCVWAGLFKDYVKHETECKHQPMFCDKCGDPVSKQKMDHHKKHECAQRMVKCNFCKKEMAKAEELQHQRDCTKLPEACKDCNKNVPRDEMKKHKSRDCPNRQVACPIEGCNPPQPLGRFQQHVQKDQPKHLAWVLSRISDIDDSLAAIVDPSSTGGASAMSLARHPEAIDILKGKLDQLEQQVQSFVRQGGAATGGAAGGSNQPSGGAEASATASGGGSATERINNMEFKVNSLEPILSVLHGEMNRCIGAIEALEGKLQQETVMARDFRQKIEQYEQTIQTISTTVSQREAKMRELEARLSNLSQDKADGTLVWRIPNFSQVRQDAIAGNVSNIHSRPFYTGPMGYKMCVRLYPNGDGMGKGTHLSLFFTLMRSPSDALLPWPFKQKVYFMLIDQSFKKHVVDAFRSEPNSSSFQRPTSEMNIATGCPLFMQLNKLNQAGHGYLKDDTMFIRVVVETDGMEDHMKQFDPRNIPLASAST